MNHLPFFIISLLLLIDLLIGDVLVPLAGDTLFHSVDNSLPLEIFQSLPKECETVSKWVEKANHNLMHNKRPTFWLDLTDEEDFHPRFNIEKGIIYLKKLIN